MIGGTVQIKCNEERYKSFCNSEAFTALVDFCKEHAVNMDVKFYTNGQLEVDRSIKNLEGMFKDLLAGSGSMLKLNK